MRSMAETFMIGTGILALSAGGAEFWVRPELSGTVFDWTTRASYQLSENDTTTPAADPTTADTIVLPPDFVAAVTNGTTAFTTLSSCALVDMRPRSRLEIAVPEASDVADWSSPATAHNAANYLTTIIKTGAGALRLLSDCAILAPNSSNPYTYDYQVAFDVREGVLELPHPAVATTVYQEMYGLSLQAGATLKLGATVAAVHALQIRGTLSGAGMITNAVAGAKSSIRVLGNSYDGRYSVFDGVIGGSVQVYAYGSRLDLTNFDNTFSDIIDTRYDGANEGVFGVYRFSKVDGKSPIGSHSTINMSNGGTLLYLGTGNETCSRSFAMNGPPDFKIDAGAYGGVNFASGWSAYSTCTNNLILTLTGSNAAPCTVSGTFAEKYAVNNAEKIGPRVSHRIVKEGTGTWRFADNNGRLNAGVYEVNDGTLQFASIAETNVVCSLGLATALFSRYSGRYDASKRVDYAFELGATNGHVATMEYTGSSAVSVNTRKFALKGDGRLVADAGALELSGFGTLNGANATLRLAGDSAHGNTLRDITNDLGRITLVKEGNGTWTLDGDLSFRGDVRVEKGVLNVTQAYRYYRVLLKENGYGAGTSSTTGWSTNFIELCEVCLFDAQGRRMNINLTDGFSTYGLGKNKLEPGRFAVTRYSDGSYPRMDHPLYALFDDFRGSIPKSAGSTQTCQSSLQVTANIHAPTRTDPLSWISIAMRLPLGSAAVASYDFVTSAAASQNMSLYAWELQGSFDAQEWISLSDSQTDLGNPTPPGADRWQKTGEVFMSGDTANGTHEGFAARRPSAAGVFANVESVSVASGATLRTLDGVTLKGLAVDPAGAGTIDGFAFAENGTLNVLSGSDSGQTITLPGTYQNVSGLEKISGWNVKLNGNASRYRAQVSGGVIKVLPPGTLILFR